MSYEADTYKDGYNRDRMFGDSLQEEVKLIIGQFGIGYNQYRDRRENTDFFIEPSKWAMRIRDRKAYIQWPNDISIRLKGAHGQPAEFDKIMAGEGQYMFYGFMSLTRDQFIQWRAGAEAIKAPHLLDWEILSLDAFRKYFAEMDPQYREKFIDHYSYTHPEPDNVKCMYIDHRLIPNITITCAAAWTPVTVQTWFNSN